MLLIYYSQVSCSLWSSRLTRLIYLQYTDVQSDLSAVHSVHRQSVAVGLIGEQQQVRVGACL